MIAAFSVSVILSLYFMWCRRGGGGWFGMKVRNSDHWALEDAIREKTQEIAALNEQYADARTYNSMDRCYIKMDREQLKSELAELIDLRPKYPLDSSRTI